MWWWPSKMMMIILRTFRLVSGGASSPWHGQACAFIISIIIIINHYHCQHHQVCFVIQACVSPWQNVQACVSPWQNPTQKATVSFTSSSTHSCKKYKLYKHFQNIDVKYSKILFLQLAKLFATISQSLTPLHRLRPRPRVLPLHVQPAGKSKFITQL